MNKKYKKWSLALMSAAAIVAPISATVACGSSTKETEKVSDPKDLAWEGMTVGDLKSKLKEEQAPTAASSNFISQIKYELTTVLYENEQKASIQYQKGFSRWNIFQAEKGQLALAKEIAAMKYNYDEVAASRPNPGFTSSNIILEGTPNAGTQVNIDKALGFTFTNGTYNSKELFDNIKNNLDAWKNKGGVTDEEKKTFTNEKLASFKTGIDSIAKLNEKLTKLDNFKDSDYNTADYPNILQPLTQIQDAQNKIFNEAKKQFTDKYETKQGGEDAWVSQRSSQYNGAKTDEEAKKYLVNEVIKTSAFGQFTYALNDSFTIEQFMATYKDDKGVEQRVFPMFNNLKITDVADATATINQNYKIFTNKAAEFANVAIDATNVKEQNAAVTELLGNKVFFLGRKTLDSSKIVVDLTSNEEKQNLSLGPILITHSLIGAKQGTASSLPWTVTKDSIKNLLYFHGAGAGQQGIDLFAQLYSNPSDPTNDDLFNQYVSDDTGSRVNDGDLGVQTYQWYARKGGMNDGFALGSMVGYANMRKNETQNPKDFQIGVDPNQKDGLVYQSSTGTTAPVIKAASGSDANLDGMDIVNYLKDAFKFQMSDLLKTQISNPALSASEKNKFIDDYITSLTDADVTNKFGSIFQMAFNNREIAYSLNAAGTVYLIASPDSGVHVFKITHSSDDWNAKYFEDMKTVAKEQAIAKAKVSWKDLYAGVFTDDQIVNRLLENDDCKKALLDITTKGEDQSPLKEWVDAKYVKFESTDTPEQKRDKIIEATKKSIVATKINQQSQDARNALIDRIGTYLVGQMDNQFIDNTIDPTQLYNGLLSSLVEDVK